MKQQIQTTEKPKGYDTMREYYSAQRAEERQEFLDTLRPGLVFYYSLGREYEPRHFYQLLQVRGSKAQFVHLGRMEIPTPRPDRTWMVPDFSQQLDEPFWVNIGKERMRYADGHLIRWVVEPRLWYLRY